MQHSVEARHSKCGMKQNREKKLHTKLKHKFMIQSEKQFLMSFSLSLCLWLNGIMVVSNKKKEKEKKKRRRRRRKKKKKGRTGMKVYKRIFTNLCLYHDYSTTEMICDNN
jgi:hypothetical protein